MEQFLKFLFFAVHFSSIVSNQFRVESLVICIMYIDAHVHLVAMHCTTGCWLGAEHRKRKREKERHRYETSLWCEVATSQQRRRRRRVRGSPCLQLPVARCNVTRRCAKLFRLPVTSSEDARSYVYHSVAYRKCRQQCCDLSACLSLCASRKNYTSRAVHHRGKLSRVSCDLRRWLQTRTLTGNLHRDRGVARNIR